MEKRGLKEEAFNLYKEAVRISPDNALVRYRRAKILISLQRYQVSVCTLAVIPGAGTRNPSGERRLTNPGLTFRQHLRIGTFARYCARRIERGLSACDALSSDGEECAIGAAAGDGAGSVTAEHEPNQEAGRDDAGR